MSEAKLHAQVCDYIRLQYPKALFNSDASGLRLTMGQAIKMKRLRSSRGYPDLMIYEPRRDYHGFFIELKREGEKLFNRKGDWRTDHLREQADMISDLKNRGYYATFGIGFEDAKLQIDKYMKLPKQ